MHKIFTAKTQREYAYFYIGQVAEITGASRKAIRHYESMGLLPPAKRQGKYRVYSERDAFLVHMIKHAQGFGFTLAELRELVTATAKASRFPLKLGRALIVRKRATLARQIADIRALDRRLVQLLRHMERVFA